MMEPHLRGLLVGIFLGVAVGGAIAVQPLYGWPSTLVVLVLIGALGWAEHVYWHRKPGAA
ncbi:MAG: hypothetical protein QOJ26_579 [Thermoplasmata archaeon]|jgi:hypothetical protein|nr:hypothetical protein [Thermoplasmata archaeon]MEA3165713.1 hypothetical protein [Thermoplasmata archaeon]